MFNAHWKTAGCRHITLTTIAFTAILIMGMAFLALPDYAYAALMEDYSEEEPVYLASNAVIALDPGHGGEEDGAIYNGIVEKDINWKITKYAEQFLHELGIRTYITKSENETLGLAERVERALDHDAVALVSFHNNWESDPEKIGSIILVPNASTYKSYISREGIDFANRIKPRLASLGLNINPDWLRDSETTTYPDGSPADYYGVIRRARMNDLVSVIIEHAYLSNDSDAVLLKNEEFLKWLGYADAAAIAEKWYGMDVSSAFTDVPASAWYSAAVQSARDKGFMSGYSDSITFGPQDLVTRGQIATIIYRQGSKSDPSILASRRFDDVSSGQYYSNPVLWASQHAIVNGYSGTNNFGPNDQATREQFICMLANYARFDRSYRRPITGDATLAGYADGWQVSNWAREAMAWAVDNGIIGANSDLRPGDSITRAEVAAILTRYW